MQDDVKAWFDALTPEQRAVLEPLRATILRTDSTLVEAIKWRQPCYSKNGVVCYLQKARAHVALGFGQGARLTDPKGRLVGTGKQMRHIKFDFGESVDHADIGALIAAAVVLDGSDA